MVWGCFWDLRKISLYIINKDFKSKKYRYSAEFYLEILKTEITPIFENLDQKY
jgi:hypothetical protein